MARLNVVDPAAATGDVKEIFDGPLKGKHLNIFKGMGNSAAALNFYLSGSGALGKASLSSKEQEVVQLVFAQANECGYCQAAHTHIGQGAGLTEDQTIAARTNSDLGDAKLTALSKFTTAVHSTAARFLIVTSLTSRPPAMTTARSLKSSRWRLWRHTPTTSTA